MAYLDHNATSPLRPEARMAMERVLHIAGNPSSVHAAGRAARAAIETAREQVAALVGANARNVVFTSGATEANTMALWGAVQGAAQNGARITRLFVSAIEHDSMLENARSIAERVAGVRLELIPATTQGTIDLDVLASQLREGKGRALVVTMAANNETGVIQPLPQIASLLSNHDAYLAVDAVQTAGKIPPGTSAHYVSLSAHKLGGPQGVGALVVSPEAPFAPLVQGGGQERGNRAGTENTMGIAGFGAAAQAVCPLPSQLRDRFEDELRTVVPSAVIFGVSATRLSSTSNFALPGISAQTAVMSLDLDQVMVSSGSACSSGKLKASHVLKAMGADEALVNSALRVSFGWNSTNDDVDAAIAAISKLVARLAQKAA